MGQLDDERESKASSPASSTEPLISNQVKDESSPSSSHSHEASHESANCRTSGPLSCSSSGCQTNPQTQASGVHVLDEEDEEALGSASPLIDGRHCLCLNNKKTCDNLLLLKSCSVSAASSLPSQRMGLFVSSSSPSSISSSIDANRPPPPAPRGAGGCSVLMDMSQDLIELETDDFLEIEGRSGQRKEGRRGSAAGSSREPEGVHYLSSAKCSAMGALCNPSSGSSLYRKLLFSRPKCRSLDNSEVQKKKIRHKMRSTSGRQVEGPKTAKGARTELTCHSLEPHGTHGTRKMLPSISRNELTTFPEAEPSTDIPCLPGPSGIHFNGFKDLRLNYIETVDSDHEEEEEAEEDYREMACGQSFRQRSHSLTPTVSFSLGNGYGFEDDDDDDLEEFVLDIDLGTSRLLEDRETAESQEDAVPEEQLTITSNGSKISASSKRSTSCLVAKQSNEQKQGTQSKSKHYWEEPDHSPGLSLGPATGQNGSNTRLTATHPHTITCRPISESSSVAQLSVASSCISDPNAPMCKICHLNAKDGDPLISPCRCAGTMQFIHCGCLMKWLEISSKKSRKPLSCELCQYQYHWHKKFKIRAWQYPHCSRRDKLLHLLFFVSVSVMVACAVITVMCFKQDRGQRIDPNRTELTQSEVVTLICGVLFFLAFFLAMYVEVKARNTLYKLLVKFVYLNQQWYIDEYEYEKKEAAAVAGAGGGPVDV